MFFKDSSGTICHTGIVESVTSGSITTIEGNTSGYSGLSADGGHVAKKSYVRNFQRIAGYGRPFYEEVDMTDSQSKKLDAIYAEVTRKDDPTGRGKKLNDHDHLKWVAKTVTDNAERITAIEEEQQKQSEMLEQIIRLLDK